MPMKETLYGKTVANFKDKKIAIVGDIMLDTGTIGDVSRISPEAPVAIIHVKREKRELGGAALVAHNIKCLCACPYMVGVVGADRTKEILVKKFEEMGIATEFLVTDQKRQTTEKIRYFGNAQQMLRLDYEDATPISKETEEKVIEQARKILPEVDVIVISDYGKGMITENVAKTIIQEAKVLKKKIIIDAKPSAMEYYKDADVVTINEKEAKEIITSIEGKDDQDFAILAAEIARKYKTSALITRGRRGITVCDGTGRIDHVKGKEVDIADITGAGDAVTSVLALALAAGYDLFDATKLANYAGGVVVTKKGSATITLEEIQKFLRLDVYEYLRESIRVKEAVIETQMDKIEELASMIIEAYKKGNKLLVFGNGGSAADAQHLAAEFVGRYKMERRGLPAIALTTDSSIITAIGNDYGYDLIFSRQVEAHCNSGDIVLGITTSGNSPNVLKAFEVAKKIGAKTAVWTGKDGGEAAKVADIAIIVPSNNTPRIQEAHVALIHIICEIFEDYMHKQGYF